MIPQPSLFDRPPTPAEPAADLHLVAPAGAPSPYADGYAPDPAWLAYYAAWCVARPLPVAPTSTAETGRWYQAAASWERERARARAASGGAPPATSTTMERDA